MKIVILGKYNEDEILTGPEKVSKRLFQYLKKINHDIVFISYFFKFTENKSNIFLRLFGKFEITSKEVIQLGVIRLFFYLIFSQPTIIFISSPERYTIPVFFYQFLLKSKFVTLFHGIIKYESQEIERGYSSINFKDLILEKLRIFFCEKLVFISKQQLEIAKIFYTINENKIIIIPNGIDNIFFKVRESVVIKNRVKIVFVGEEEWLVKGFDFIYDCLSKSNLIIDLYLIRSWSKKYKNFESSNLNLTIVDKMNPYRLNEFYSDKHIFISGSYYDSFGMAIAEAMSNGLIPVITSACGVSKYIDIGKNGFVYEYGDNKKLIEILSDICNDKYDLLSLSNNASKIIETLNWDNIAKEYFKQFEMLINE